MLTSTFRYGTGEVKNGLNWLSMENNIWTLLLIKLKGLDLVLHVKLKVTFQFHKFCYKE
jgi:hypothetical protein